MDRRQFLFYSPAVIVPAALLPLKGKRVRVDDLIGDDTAKIAAASNYAEVDFSNRTYVFNGEFQIKPGQVIRLNGATLTHTDNTKRFFTAIGVNGWSLLGPGTVQGTLSTMGTAAEKGLYVEGCNRYRVNKITAQLFLNSAFHIAPGVYAPVRSDQGQWSDCSAFESIIGLQIDAGTGAEYNIFTGFKAAGNITGAQIAAGNTSIIGGDFTDNVQTGVLLLGGSNNGHGMLVGLNVNHNPLFNLKAVGVSNGFTIQACHFYGDSGQNGEVGFYDDTNAVPTNRIVLANCTVDCPVRSNTTGTNRLINCNTSGGTFFSIGGTNPSGIIQSGNY